MYTPQQIARAPRHIPIVAVDMDGVLVANPPEALAGTINDWEYWHKHWKDTENVRFNKEIVDTVIALVSSGWHATILTARPDTYKICTEPVLHKAFRRRGIDVANVIAPNTIGLHMRPTNVEGPSSIWKYETIKTWIDFGFDIRLMIEDYKPNADAIRNIVPVLLYERKKLTDAILPMV